MRAKSEVRKALHSSSWGLFPKPISRDPIHEKHKGFNRHSELVSSDSPSQSRNLTDPHSELPKSPIKGATRFDTSRSTARQQPKRRAILNSLQHLLILTVCAR